MTELALETAAGFSEAEAEVFAPDGRSSRIALAGRARLDPKDVRSLAYTMLETRQQRALIVVSRYPSESTRARLRENEINYLDLTGNVRIVVTEPGLFIETQGASEDPERQERPARSLRGPKAGRIARALIDYREPRGVRELAALTKVDAGYVSRVLAYLDTEALITRIGRGRIQTVDWPALLRRWAQEAPLELRGQARTYLEPRGLSTLVGRLATSEERYAVTGALAAAAFTSIAPARLATIWVRSAADAATGLDLRSADVGANVLLIEPDDEAVFESVALRDGIWYAAPSQVAADLLTSPGRGPAEGDELINWMLANEEKWRR